METTRGARELPRGFSRETEIARLRRAIRSALDEKRSVLIRPSP